MGDVRIATMFVRDFPLLYIFRNTDVGYAMARVGSTHSHIDDIDCVSRPHHPLVEDRNVHVELVKIDILLIVHADQVMKGMTGNGKHRLQIAFCVIKTVKKMNPSRPGCRAAHSNPAGVFGISNRCKRGSFFVADLYEFQLVLMSSECFEETVHSIPGKAKNRIHSPLNQALNDEN